MPVHFVPCQHVAHFKGNSKLSILRRVTKVKKKVTLSPNMYGQKVFPRQNRYDLPRIKQLRSVVLV